MKINFVVCILLSLMIVLGCKSEVQNSESASIQQMDPAAADVTLFNLSNTTAIYKGSDNSNLSSFSQSTSIKKIYKILSDGSYGNFTYFGSDGVERDFIFSIDRIVWISKRYAVVTFYGGLGFLVNLSDGSVLKLNSYDLEVSSLVVFGDYLFGFSKDLRQLKRVNLLDQSSRLYITLPESSNFVPGNRVVMSSATMWWNDEGGIPDNSRSFASMLIDEDLNALAQIEEPDPIGNGMRVYPMYSISPTGHRAKNNFTYHNGTYLNFVYFDKKLYATIPQFSGPSNSANITFNRVHITQDGFVFDEVEKIFPFGGILSGYSRAQLYCRDSYTPDSPRRYIIMYWGVINYNSANISSPLSFSYSSANMGIMESVASFPAPYLPSRSCQISGDDVYFMNSDHTKVLRSDLRNVSRFSYSVVVSNSDMKSFVVVGKYIFYSTGSSGVFRADLDGSDVQPYSSNELPDINDVININ